MVDLIGSTTPSSIYGYGLGNGTLSTLGQSTPLANDLRSVSGFGIPQATTGATGATAAGGFGFNIPTLQLGLGALNSIGSLYGAFSSQGIARDQLNLQKEAYAKNMANSISAYNTALEDKARSRGVVEGTSSADTQSYIDSHKLT